MSMAAINTVDFLAAQAHARYGRLAAAERTESWLRLGSVAELARAVGADAEVVSCAAFQRWMAWDLASELLGFARGLGGAGAALIQWLATAGWIEDLKTRVRGLRSNMSPEAYRRHLLELPGEFVRLSARLDGARSLESFGAALPFAPLRRAFQDALHRGPDESWPGSLEAVLDRAFLVESLARARRLPTDDRELVVPLVRQEIDLFHLRLALGTAVGSGPGAERWAQLHVPGTLIPRAEFAALRLGGPGEIRRLRGVRRVAGVAVDSTCPVEPADIERRAWRRYRLLAWRAFRRRHVGLAALVGYAGLRRMETADLITLSEGLRLGVDPQALRERLFSTPHREVRDA